MNSGLPIEVTYEVNNIDDDTQKEFVNPPLKALIKIVKEGKTVILVKIIDSEDVINKFLKGSVIPLNEIKSMKTLTGEALNSFNKDGITPKKLLKLI